MDNAQAAIQSALEERLPSDGPGLALHVVRGGETLWQGGRGMANLEWGIPIAADTIFRIGSITKQFTAAAIMLLVEDGKLDVDDELRSILPAYPNTSRRGRITVRHLLTHTSGIQNYTALPDFDRRKDRSPQELIAVFKDRASDFEPGERFEYSNSGYVLLGAIIEALSGESYRSVLRDRILRPLSLRDTRYLFDEPIIKRRASGYGVGPKGVTNARTLSMTAPYAAGGLGSTVGDLVRWEAALRGGALVSTSSYAAMTEPGTLNDGTRTPYGFGLSLAPYRDIALIGHAGGINGFHSMLQHLPQHDITVAALSNFEQAPLEQLILTIVRRLLGLADIERTRVQASDDELARCVGIYLVHGMPVEVGRHALGLTLSVPAAGSRYLPCGERLFYLEQDPEVSVRFQDKGQDGYRTIVLQGPTLSVQGERRASG